MSALENFKLWLPTELQQATVRVNYVDKISMARRAPTDPESMYAAAASKWETARNSTSESTHNPGTHKLLAEFAAVLFEGVGIADWIESDERLSPQAYEESAEHAAQLVTIERPWLKVPNDFDPAQVL